MYKFVVHLERELCRHWEFPDDAGRNTYYADNVTSLSEKYVEWPDIGKMETWYFNEKKYAELFAKKMSALYPGRHVLILQTISVAQTPPGNTVISEVSEKGILPK